MGVFDKYYAEKAQYDSQHPVNMVKVRVQDNPNFNLSILKQNIGHIDEMSDVELRKFILRSFKSILNNLFQGKDADKYIKYFQDVRFLDAFIDVVVSMQFLEKDDIVRCNTLCYHYLTLPKEQQDSMVLARMLKLSSIVNRFNLPRLLGLGLSENLASMLLIARYSDIDLNVCVKRVDFIIITQPKELMSEKMIEEIFKCIYNVMDDFYRVFPYMMMDVIPDYDENNEKTWWVTDDIIEVNSIMNLSILNILDNLPSQTIRNILLNYSEGQYMVNKYKPVRFSLKNLSADYYRINGVINELLYNEGIVVP